MNDEPFEVEPLAESSAFYAKGHIDPGKFIEQIAARYMGWDEEECKRAEKDVVHCLGRFVPLLPHQRYSFNFDYFVYFDQEKKRGAFPMTYVDV